MRSCIQFLKDSRCGGRTAHSGCCVGLRENLGRIILVFGVRIACGGSTRWLLKLSLNDLNLGRWVWALRLLIWLGVVKWSWRDIRLAMTLLSSQRWRCWRISHLLASFDSWLPSRSFLSDLLSENFTLLRANKPWIVRALLQQVYNHNVQQHNWTHFCQSCYNVVWNLLNSLLNALCPCL